MSYILICSLYNSVHIVVMYLRYILFYVFHPNCVDFSKIFVSNFIEDVTSRILLYCLIYPRIHCRLRFLHFRAESLWNMQRTSRWKSWETGAGGEDIRRNGILGRSFSWSYFYIAFDIFTSLPEKRIAF